MDRNDIRVLRKLAREHAKLAAQVAQLGEAIQTAATEIEALNAALKAAKVESDGTDEAA